MVNDKQENVDEIKEIPIQAGALEGQLHMISGVERSLAVTCESIIDKMKQLEQKMDDMEKRYVDLAKDAEKVLKESKIESGGGGENKQQIHEQNNE